MIDHIPLSAILARDSQNHIADNSFLPWHNDASTKWDMENFKKLTTGNIIYMGFNTAGTFKKPLPGRINVIEDRTAEPFQAAPLPGQETFIRTDSLQSFISGGKTLFENEWKEKKLFLIGGAKLLKKYAAFIDEFYLTTFSKSYSGDIFFDEDILKNFSERKTIESHPNGIMERYSRGIGNPSVQR